jgi:formylglycine-generating enzyme required for sulfatase activity
VNYVSFWDAARFANWLHNGQPTGAQGPGTTEGGAYHNVGNQTLFGRNAGAKFFIPTENEWYKSAYHDHSAGLGASYFDYPTGSNAVPINTLPDPGNHANFFDVYGTGTGNYTIGPPYYRTNIGHFANSASPYGTLDQGGNVWEWNETILFSSSRGLRGGSLYLASDSLHASYRGSTIPTNEASDYGFRVASASVPEPATGLLAASIFALLACRYRRPTTSPQLR